MQRYPWPRGRPSWPPQMGQGEKLLKRRSAGTLLFTHPPPFGYDHGDGMHHLPMPTAQSVEANIDKLGFLRPAGRGGIGIRLEGSVLI
jgi:hypothetical protein